MVSLFQKAKAFWMDTHGQISIVFALTSMVVVMAVGTGVDLSRSYLALQELSQTATMACQYASRPNIIKTATSQSTSSYRTKVSDYVTKTLTEQRYGYNQTNGSPFSYTSGAAGSVTLASDVGTTFMQIFGVSNMPVRTTSHCFDNPASITQHLTDPTGKNVLAESFEANANDTAYIFFPPSGAAGGTFATPQSTFPTNPNYVGATGIAWHIMGYCLETDRAGVIRSSVTDGTRSAELDCDEGSGTRGNSSISAKVYLEAGYYELRYNYTLRTTYPEYKYSVICGSTAADIAWATNGTVGGGGGSGIKSNQINVYIDADTTSSAPPTHTAMGGITLAGSSLVDTCLYADDWIERSIRIRVNNPAFYWITFAADGNNDSYGGQIDDIRFCRLSCTDTLTDNFIAYWLTNPALFRDQFETTSYTATHTNLSTAGNLNSSTGTNNASGTGGWPNQTARGWATTPSNQMDILMSGRQYEGNYAIELDASTPTPTNRSISRSFLLVPGYYRLQYRYVSDATFVGLGVTTYCGATPTTAGYVSSASSTSAAQVSRIDAGIGNRMYDTNIVGVFMSHSQLISQPQSGGALNSTTSYLNPTGTTTTTPTNAPDAISLSAYNASQNNPLLDLCAYSASWIQRTAYIKIEKTNYYLLTFAALGAADNLGGAIDDVTLTAISSLYSTAPTGAVTIPSYGQQPNTVITQSGYSIMANVLTPPAAMF